MLSARVRSPCRNMAPAKYVAFSEEGRLSRLFIDDLGAGLVSQTFQLDKGARKWRLTDRDSFALGVGQFGTWSIVGAERRVENETGKRVPLVLLQQSKVRWVIVALRDDSSRGRTVRPIRVFSIPTNAVDSLPDSVQMVDGPGLCWLRNSELFTALCPGLGDTRLQLSSMELRSGSRDAVLLWSGYVEDLHVFFGLLASSSHRRDFFACCVASGGSFSDPTLSSMTCSNPLPALRPSDFIPDDYAAVVCIVTVVSRSIFGNDSTEAASGRVTLATHVIAGTELGHIMEFVGGKLTRCLHVPSLGACISLENLETFDGCRRLVLLSETKTVFAVNETMEEICNTWHGVQDVLIDDFAGCGTDQLLLLLQDTFVGENFPSTWILTDWGLNHIQNVSVPEETKLVNEDTCPVAAKRAFKTRIQHDLILLQESERRLEAKSRFILESFDQLMGKDTSFSQKDTAMITLIENVGLQKKESAIHPKQCNTLTSMEVVEIWQRLFDDKWIVGLDFICNAKKWLKNVCLSVVRCRDSDLSVSSAQGVSKWFSSEDITRVVQTTQDFDLGSFPAKRIHLTNQRPEHVVDRTPSQAIGMMAAVCVSQIPELGLCSDVEFLVFLHWEEDGENGTKCVRSCGKVRFDVKMLSDASAYVHLSKGFECNGDADLEVRRVTLALNTIQARTTLAVTAQHSHLAHLHHWLQTRCLLDWSKSLGCFFFRGLGVLHHLRVYIQSADASSAMLTVYSRDDLTLVTFVHHLYSCLPDDIIILPGSQDEDSRQKVRDCLRSLKEETQFVGNKFQQLIKEDAIDCLDQDVSIDSMDSLGKLSIKKIRENLARQKMLFEKDQRIPGYLQKLKQLMQEWEPYEDQVDTMISDIF